MLPSTNLIIQKQLHKVCCVSFLFLSLSLLLSECPHWSPLCLRHGPSYRPDFLLLAPSVHLHSLRHERLICNGVRSRGSRQHTIWICAARSIKALSWVFLASKKETDRQRRASTRLHSCLSLTTVYNRHACFCLLNQTTIVLLSFLLLHTWFSPLCLCLFLSPLSQIYVVILSALGMGALFGCLFSFIGVNSVNPISSFISIKPDIGRSVQLAHLINPLLCIPIGVVCGGLVRESGD